MARLDRGPAAGVAYGSAAPAIEVRGLSFAYPDADAAVLEGLDWSVPQGAFALLVGGTGSGKSTLLSLLKPEIAPAGERTGELRVLGENVADMDVRASAERVGYVFQDPENQIVCETVWHEMAFGLENLGVSRDEMRRRVAETSYFFGLEDWLHRDTDTLSGGRKQLLSLTAVLALRPRVLLLDEPTSQLDPVAEKNFLHALFRVNRELGCTVVVATHQPRPMLEYATRAYRIEGGRVREVADMASLGRRESLFSDEMLGWGAIRCAKNGVFSRREDNLGSLEPPGDVSSAKKSSELDKSSEFVAQTSLENGSEAFPRTDGSRILQKMHGGSATTLSEGWFRYDRAGGWVLRGLDVAFSASAVHAIVGGNGCGKSTMLSVLAKTAKLQRGRMVRGAASAALLPQNPKALLVAETVRDELMEWASTCGYDENLARERAAQLGLDGLETRHPYDLSGGQRQLLALAKLLLIGPELLLLDEPTKGLDLESRRIIARALRDHAKAGGTVIMATHDLDFAEQVADDVAMMFDGEIACMEPRPTSLPTTCSIGRDGMTDCRFSRLLTKLEIPLLLAVPAVMAAALLAGVEQAALAMLVVVALVLALFFAGYEASRPGLRQIMPTLVLAALAAAGRILFGPIPDFKPVSAIAIIAGATLGRRNGFMVGALAALTSNFFFGQGMWTPWQMYAWGLVGYVGGALAHAGAFDRADGTVRMPALMAYGFASGLLYGVVINAYDIIGFVQPLTWAGVVARLATAVPFDITHGLATCVFLAALYKPWCRRINRVVVKYGL